MTFRPIYISVIDIAGLAVDTLFVSYLLCSCPTDIKATGLNADDWFQGMTAVEVAKYEGCSDIVEFLNTYQSQPRGELHCLSGVDFVYRKLDQISCGPAHPYFVML